MEDGLGRIGFIVYAQWWHVLILVLMEDGLGLESLTRELLRV